MLIDLVWTKEHAHLRERADWITEFNTTNGNLVVTYTFPDEKVFRTQVAERVHSGVYWAWNLWNDIETYTHWSVEHPWTETQEIYKALEKASPEEADRLRELLFRTKSNYGNADDLKQVFHYGRNFVRSANPYVLEIRPVNVENNDRYMEKNGPYIGNKKKLVEVIHFAFHKLKGKEQWLRS